jgi:integrase
VSWAISLETRLDDLVRDWLDDLTGQIDQDTTGELYQLHWTTHLIPFFGSAVSITKASIAAYGRARLRRVKRATLQKERSTLRGFLDWCVERGFLTSPIDFPPLPKRAPGTAWHQNRRGAATELSPEECAMLLAVLPAWSVPRGGRVAFPVRARFIVAYETSLRPATLDALSVPEHWSRGSSTLIITDEIDKARFGRELPLTPTALAALESVGKRGLIFGEHDYRYQLKKAAKQVLPAAKARSFTGYDFRHAAGTHWAETGNLPAVAYMMGHTQLTTTNRYAKPNLRAAKNMLGDVRRAISAEKCTATRTASPSLEVLAG